jgi:thiosulfate/3-mercaptopyruvate sulfurtransferase
MALQLFRLLGTLAILPLLLIGTSFAAATPPNPWSAGQLVQPEILAQSLKQSPKDKPPFIVHVGFSIFFKNGHIPGSVYAGPTNSPAGMDLLRRAVEHLARDYPIVIYCGCCPLVKCPNVRPAFRELRAMGFKNVTLLNLPDSLDKNWIAKGFPNQK